MNIQSQFLYIKHCNPIFASVYIYKYTFIPNIFISSIKFQNTHKCLLRNFNGSYLAHTLFTFFCFSKSFSYGLCLRRNTLQERLFCMPSPSPWQLFTTDACLYRYLKLLPWDSLFEFFGNSSSPGIRFFPVDYKGQGVNNFPV